MLGKRKRDSAPVPWIPPSYLRASRPKSRITESEERLKSLLTYAANEIIGAQFQLGRNPSELQPIVLDILIRLAEELQLTAEEVAQNHGWQHLLRKD